MRKDIQKSLSDGTQSSLAPAKEGHQNYQISGQGSPDNHSNIYNLAVQSLQNYCLNKADLIMRDSDFLRETIFQNLSDTVKDQQKVS